MSQQQALYLDYLSALKTNFTKIAKLEFLNPDGGVAFVLDNQSTNRRSKAFLQEGNISCSLQNGARRQATVTLANLDNEYEYAVNKIWFGQQIRLSEGLVLPGGIEYYIPQGIFCIEEPGEALEPGKKTATFQIVDKWANLDGTLGGNLEGPYSVTAGTNIFAAMASILKLDRFTMESNGPAPIDRLSPIFTSWYNGKTQKLTDGSSVPLTEAPYDYLSDDSGTLADVELGLAEMLAAWIGYNQAGRLVVDPSQDDILDTTKPVIWDFRIGDGQFLGAEYQTRLADIHNDIIVVGATDDLNATARGRAQNLDPASDTCISRIGLKTKRISMSDYYSDDICQSYAAWQLKRSATVSKKVSISSTQMFHLVENEIITLQRPDKPGNPVERHVIQGFSRPIGQTGNMTIDAISVNDYPIATIVENEEKE